MSDIARVGGEANLDLHRLATRPHAAGQVGVLELGEMCRFIQAQKHPLRRLIPIDVTFPRAITKPEIAVGTPMEEDPAFTTSFILRELEGDQMMEQRMTSE